MMAASLRLGKIFGIPLGLNYSWFIIFAFVTFTLAVYYFPPRIENWPATLYWLISLVTSLLFFGSIVVHELAHCAVSIATGVPVKSITLFVFGGVAQIERDPSRPRDEFLMALAGPVASFATGLLFGGIFFVAQHFNDALAAFSLWLAIINLTLGATNLFPGFPLDGGRILRSMIWQVNGNLLQATHIASAAGRVGGYLLILGGLLLIFRGGLFEGVWLVFVGWFLDSSAQSSLRHTRMRHGLEGLTARDLMSGDFPQVAPTLSVGELVRERLLRSIHRTYLVVDDDDLLGIVSPQSVKPLPRSRWDTVSVREIMVPIARLRTASISDDAATLLDSMDEHNLAQLPVQEEGRIVGLIRRDSLLQLIRTRSELGV